MKAMNCQDFDRRLDALLEGACSEDEWREAETHLAHCRRCGALFEGAAGRGGVLDAAAQAALTASVMNGIGGDPCASARDRLCDFVDGALEPFDRELVAVHLSGCAACAALAGALARSTAVLPSFAAATPRGAFVEDVLAATSRRPAAPTLADRLVDWLGRAAMRPRFGFEVAYVCTLLLAIAFGNPVKAFKETASKGAAFAQPRVEVAVERVAVPLAAVKAKGEAVVGKTVGRLASGGSAGTDGGVMQAARQWWQGSVVQRLRSWLGTAAGWVRATQEMANDLATRLLGEHRPTGPAAGEPPPAPVP
jgi:predicted anti-sigma-YlaC factor YlaD